MQGLFRSAAFAAGFVMAAALAGAAQATPIVCEPDDFAPGAALTNACNGVTLTGEGTGPLITASGFTNFTSTGDSVFAGSFVDFDAGEFLRGDFAVLTDFVSIDAIATFNLTKFAVLSVYDLSGILLDSITLSSAGIMNLTISRPSADIAFFRATAGQSGNYVNFDNLRFNVPTAVPEPATLALFGAGLIGMARLHRRRR